MKTDRLYNNMVRAMLAACCLLATACSSDDATDGGTDRLRLSVYSNRYTDTEATTRADGVPAGFDLFGTLYPDAGDVAIGVWLTGATSQPLLEKLFYQGSDQWESQVRVQPGKTYYLYGFMPVSEAVTATVAAPAGGYAQGADITLDGVGTVSADDICVVVGVQGVASATAARNVAVGEFTYAAGGNGTNYVHLLMAHVYASVLFNITVDAQYHELRTIRLKGLTLSATIDTGSAVVHMARGTGIGAIDFTATGTATDARFTFYDSDEGTDLSPNAAEAFSASGFILPYTSAPPAMSLTATYDVLDKKGNTVRTAQTATNKLPATLFPATMAASDRLVVNLTVKPTYLYQLSEPDLDNPTITIE